MLPPTLIDARPATATGLGTLPLEPGDRDDSRDRDDLGDPRDPGADPDAELFHAYSRHLRAEFGARTYKVTIAGSATCPTRDGSLGRGGCAFCDVYGSGSYYAGKSKRESVHAQIDARLPGVAKRFDATKFLAYFQAYTNTYGDLDELRELFESALDHPMISGLTPPNFSKN